jgi:hypothetical protein
MDIVIMRKGHFFDFELMVSIEPKLKCQMDLFGPGWIQNTDPMLEILMDLLLRIILINCLDLLLQFINTMFGQVIESFFNRFYHELN